jgi:site-specific recombinase XerD
MDFKKFVSENFQEKVAENYIRDYNEFIKYLMENQKEATDVKKLDIMGYIEWLRDKRTKDTTINRKLSCIRKFYKQMRIEKIMLENPLEEIKQMKIYKKENEVTEDKINEIINKVESKRDKLILQLLIEEKIKPKEIIEIQIKNIDLKKKIIFSENKAKVINDKTLEMIEGMGNNTVDDFLIQNQHNKQVKLSGIYFIINQYLGAEMKPQELLKYSHN